MSSAEKQASYRQRKLDAGGERLQAVISMDAKRAIERLARHHGLGQAVMLERLILEAQSRITANMDGDEHLVYVGESVTR